MADRGDALVAVMAALPVLATRFGWGFLRYQARRKRGVRAFRRALVQSGMPADRAAHLAQAYHEFGSVRQLIRGGLARRAGRGPKGSPRRAPST